MVVDPTDGPSVRQGVFLFPRIGGEACDIGLLRAFSQEMALNTAIEM